MTDLEREELRDELRTVVCGPRCHAHEGVVNRVLAVIERRDARYRPATTSRPPGKQGPKVTGERDAVATALRALAGGLYEREFVTLTRDGVRIDVRHVDVADDLSDVRTYEAARIVPWTELTEARYPSMTLAVALDRVRGELNRARRDRGARERGETWRPLTR